ADVAELLENLVRRRHGLGEHRHPVRQRVRNPMQHSRGDDHQLCERSVGADDALHAPGGTVAREALATPGAGSGAEVGLADHTRPAQRRIRCGDHLTHPLVTRDAAEAEIASADLQVGAADAGQVNAHERLGRPGHRIGEVGHQTESRSVEAQGAHSRTLHWAGAAVMPRWKSRNGRVSKRHDAVRAHPRAEAAEGHRAPLRRQAVQFMLADMAVEVEAMRLLTYKAAWLIDQGATAPIVSAYAKAVGADHALKSTPRAVPSFAGYGYMKEYPVEKLMRDAKLLQIYEGTSQVQRVVIARNLLKG